MDYFSKSRFVRELTPKDFNPKKTWELKEPSSCSVILWYAPWCPHCKAVKGTWKRLGETATFMDVFAFNCEKHKGHLSKIQEDMPELVRSYPTITFYKRGKPVEEYRGDRSLNNLLKEFMRVCQDG